MFPSGNVLSMKQQKKWICYDQSTSTQIEALSNGEKLVLEREGNYIVEIIKLTTSQGTETNLTTKKQTPISSFNTKLSNPPLPDWWINDQKNVLIILSSIDQKKNFQVQSAVQQVNKFVKNKKIVNVGQIQNIKLWAKYCLNKLLWTHHQFIEDNTNEKLLWVGVNENEREVICQQGFSIKNGDYGYGLYFNVFPNQALTPKNMKSYGKYQYLICAIVTCGESCVGKETLAFSKRPTKPKTKIKYETMVDDATQPTVYVAGFENQVYPFLLFKIT